MNDQRLNAREDAFYVPPSNNHLIQGALAAVEKLRKMNTELRSADYWRVCRHLS
jgi:hypothetical protein